ncbi:hypothetical protein FKM82_012838 [Ascaphus truei]
MSADVGLPSMRGDWLPMTSCCSSRWAGQELSGYAGAEGENRRHYVTARMQLSSHRRQCLPAASPRDVRRAAAIHRVLSRAQECIRAHGCRYVEARRVYYGLLFVTKGRSHIIQAYMVPKAAPPTGHPPAFQTRQPFLKAKNKVRV